MTDATNIPLSKLVPWTGNVRKTAGAGAALDELAASIAAHGLLQSLVVRKHKRGKFAVVAGQRRLRALLLLAGDGRIDADMEIPCRILGADAAAYEISLAENALREQMHPADEFEAFRELVDAGASTADIAARFGYSENAVEKRLRLARVSPVIIDAYRREEITLEEVMAFAVTDDHAAQERVWSEAPPWLRADARAIREALTEDEIAASDPRVRFVTLEAYEKEGGGIRRDLFAEGDRGAFILDAALLSQLAASKLEEAAEEVRKEGWKWVEVHPEFGYAEAGQYKRRHPNTLPLDHDEAAELAVLEEEDAPFYDAEGDLSDEQQARLDAITARMEELTYEREKIWPAETLEIAGAVVSIDRDGEADVTRGLIRPEDAPKEAKAVQANGSTSPGVGLSASLAHSLTAQRSAALTATLTGQANVALAAVVHALASQVIHGEAAGSSLQLIIRRPSLKGIESSKAFAAIEDARASWTSRIPGEPAELWAWCLDQDQKTLLDLLAFCAALTLDATLAKGQHPASERMGHADAIAAATGFYMPAWFCPTAENFFTRVSKPQILAALQELKGGVSLPPAWSSMKKSELAVMAEREASGTDWLPAPLRLYGAGPVAKAA